MDTRGRNDAEKGRSKSKLEADVPVPVARPEFDASNSACGNAHVSQRKIKRKNDETSGFSFYFPRADSVAENTYLRIVLQVAGSGLGKNCLDLRALFAVRRPGEWIYLNKCIVFRYRLCRSFYLLCVRFCLIAILCVKHGYMIETFDNIQVKVID